jgi:hypothetical protein
MSTLYIAEYEKLLVDAHGDVVLAPKAPPLVEQTVAIGLSSASAANPFTTRTRFIQVSTDTTCSIAFGPNPTATTGNQRLAANEKVFIGVEPGDLIAVIENS